VDMPRKLLAFTLALPLIAGCSAQPLELVPSEAAPPPSSTTTSGAATFSSRPEDSVSSPAEVPPPECDGSFIFSHAPVDLDAVEYLLPFGLMTDSHVTPVDHHYFQNFLEPDREIEVYSPGAGRVVSIQHFGSPVAENREGLVDDFRIVIEHTCTISSIFIHIDRLVPKLAEHDPGIGNYAGIDVAVEAGELIGTFTENVDFNLVDLDFVTDGLIDPASYAQEPWKIHVPDTFAYFTPELATRLEDLSLRTAEPRAGRFAYDLDGRLAGNWFGEGSNGYAGTDPDRYWAGHLTFAYDYLDPAMVVVSIGTYDGTSRQFAVAGNGPDPAAVSVDSGLVVYELVDWDYWIGEERWDRHSFASGITAAPGSSVAGVIAVQMVTEREVLVEVLPGITADQISGIGPEATLYTR
jgi:hypothetical protein